MAVNLLPWRAMQQRAHRRRFYGWAGCGVGMAFLILWVLWLVMTRQYQVQQSSHQKLVQQLQVLAPQLAQVATLEQDMAMYHDRLEQFSQWHHDRFPLITLLNQLPVLLPASVYLERLTLTSGQIKLVAQTSDAAAITQFLSQSEAVYGPGLLRLNSVERPGALAGGQRFYLSMDLPPTGHGVADE
ncbi:PilN domain-containing protein [Photobacterium sp. 1_MG-2023]|uniref:PilN domain-containing protein n=1 Tax=Photobacterium sp. 1_MG-2023 TaxID=3062646 RepID=UPI0026E129B1|nr:PilN domain-containing protein [Photobacterium sp. 1_MG-2023]MDO6706230.1 hypothetical protein [Photobacterium sp. 1_MG-2023]